MNQGLTIAKGSFVWFLNAGDEFATSLSLNFAINEITRTNAAMVIGGFAIAGDNYLKKYSFPPKIISTNEFSYNRRGGCHQAMVFDRMALLKIGGFQTKFQLAADFDAVLQLTAMFKVIRIGEVIAKIEPGGAADLNLGLVFREKHQSRLAHMPGMRTWVWSFIWTKLAQANQIQKRRLNIINNLLNKR